MKAVDAIVIGAGQAGNPLSHNLADKGWEVVLIEREHLGVRASITAVRPPKP